MDDAKIIWLRNDWDNPLVQAVATAVCGAVLALAQRDLKRVLAFSTITDMGLLTAGVVLGECRRVPNHVPRIGIAAGAKRAGSADYGCVFWLPTCITDKKGELRT